nr:hypothetical protein [Actinomycetales bacterium]
MADVSRGAWLAERLEGRAPQDAARHAVDALAGTVPSGYPAIVRVLHPFTRDRLVTGTLADLRISIDAGEIAEVPDMVDGGEVAWHHVAAAHGTLGDDSVLRGDVLSHEVLGTDFRESRDEESADGWRYTAPEQGRLTADLLARIAPVLARHTATPDRGIAAVWEGYGGLTSSQGLSWLVLAPDGPTWMTGPGRRLWAGFQQRLAGFMMRRRAFGTQAAIRHLVRPGGPQPLGSGILPREAARGPRLELPARGYVCFEAGIDEFRDDRWLARAPWLEPLRTAAGEGAGPDRRSAQSPNLVWPEDRAWVMVSEIDFDSTLIACSVECADALLQSDGIEALPISRETRLWPH